MAASPYDFRIRGNGQNCSGRNRLSRRLTTTATLNSADWATHCNGPVYTTNTSVAASTKARERLVVSLEVGVSNWKKKGLRYLSYISWLTVGFNAPNGGLRINFDRLGFFNVD